MPRPVPRPHPRLAGLVRPAASAASSWDARDNRRSLASDPRRSVAGRSSSDRSPCLNRQRAMRAGSQPAVNAALRRLAEEGLVRAEEGRKRLSPHAQPGASRGPSRRAARRHPHGTRAPASRRDRRVEDRACTHASPRATLAGAGSSSGSPTTSTTGPATTQRFPRSQRPTCGGFVASTRPSSASCAATRSLSPVRRPLSSSERQRDETDRSAAPPAPPATVRSPRLRRSVAWAGVGRGGLVRLSVTRRRDFHRRRRFVHGSGERGESDPCPRLQYPSALRSDS